MRTHGVTHWDPDNCRGCHYKTIQLRSTTAFQPHFNYSVGRYVSTEYEFTQALKRSAEANTLATGTEHNYEMRDPAELRAEGSPYPQSDDIINTQGRELARKYAS